MYGKLLNFSFQINYTQTMDYVAPTLTFITNSFGHLK